MRYLPTWFPGAGFHRKAKVWARDFAAMGGRPYDYAKEQFVRQTIAIAQLCGLTTRLVRAYRP